MKNYATLFALFFSVMIISAQKKLPEPKTDTYTLSRYYPKGDGYILSNLNFKSKVVLKQPGRDKYAWGAVVYHKHNDMSVDGYIYKGITYSANELLSEFNINSNSLNSGVFLRIKVVFNNGKNYSSSVGAVGAHHTFDYVDNDENTNFGLSSISIVNNPKGIYIEGTIKRELAIKEQKRKNEELRKKEEERLRVEAENKKIEEERLMAEAQKKEEERLKKLEIENKKNESREKRFEEEKKEENRQAEIEANERKEELRLKKEAIDRNLEIEKKRIEKESADNAAVRRRLAERRKEEEAKKKRKQAADIKRASKMGANAITGSISALSDWDESFIGVRMSSRTLSSGNIEDSFSPTTYEFTMGQGGAGFFVGYGSPDIGNDSFGTLLGGFEKQLLNVNNIFKLGLVVEGGKGDLWDNPDDRSDEQQDQVWFYGGGVYIKLLKYGYFSYTVGNTHFNKETTTWIDRNSTTETSEFTELYSGLRFGINIPL